MFSQARKKHAVYVFINVVRSALSKGYRPEARGYVIYSPRALPRAQPEGNARGE